MDYQKGLISIIVPIYNTTDKQLIYTKMCLNSIVKNATRPYELQSHWEREYPEIDVASAKIGILERHGYSPEAYFFLPTYCWRENYYRPLQNGFDEFLIRNDQSDQSKVIVEKEKQEIALYEKYRDYYSYGVYIAKKI